MDIDLFLVKKKLFVLALLSFVVIEMPIICLSGHFWKVFWALRQLYLYPGNVVPRVGLGDVINPVSRTARKITLIPRVRLNGYLWTQEEFRKAVNFFLVNFTAYTRHKRGKFSVTDNGVA